MENKKIAILGSTGSIGKNVLRVAAQFPERFQVAGLTAGWNTGLLKEQVLAFRPSLVSVADEQGAVELAGMLPNSYKGEIVWGRQGNEQVATLAEVDMVVSAIVGAAGLLPTLAAIRAGKNIALANKETLVMAGRLVMDEVRKTFNPEFLNRIDELIVFRALDMEDMQKIVLFCWIRSTSA